MFKFKVVYKDGQGKEIEVVIELPSLSEALAAQKLGVSKSSIRSVRQA